jgi:hypothetical protein
MTFFTPQTSEELLQLEVLLELPEGLLELQFDELDSLDSEDSELDDSEDSELEDSEE